MLFDIRNIAHIWQVYCEYEILIEIVIFKVGVALKDSTEKSGYNLLKWFQFSELFNIDTANLSYHTVPSCWFNIVEQSYSFLWDMIRFRLKALPELRV